MTRLLFFSIIGAALWAALTFFVTMCRIQFTQDTERRDDE